MIDRESLEFRARTVTFPIPLVSGSFSAAAAVEPKPNSCQNYQERVRGSGSLCESLIAKLTACYFRVASLVL
jgi:hypothetical protein